MGWLEFIAAISKTCAQLAWPAVGLSAIWAFKNPVFRVFDGLRIRQLRYGGLELTFDDRLAVVEKAETLVIRGVERLPGESTGSQPPYERITKAWYKLRRIVWSLAEKSGKQSGSRLQVSSNINWLEEKDIVDEETAAILRDLKKLRDDAKKMSSGSTISHDEADRFIGVASRTGERLQAIKTE